MALSLALSQVVHVRYLRLLVRKVVGVDVELRKNRLYLLLERRRLPIVENLTVRKLA